MSTCNDPKCPLNRQGVPHEIHELIESRPIKNQCNDARCAMNRMGMKHNVHDENINDPQIKQENPSKTRKYFEDDENLESFNDSLQELSKRLHRDYSHQFSKPSPKIDYADDYSQEPIPNEKSKKLSREEVILERTKREREKIEEQPQEENKRREGIQDENKEKIHPRSRIFSRSSDKQNIPSINQILQSNDPYKTFNLTENTTCDEIKSKYKELSRSYNAAFGSVNRTHEEQELLTKTQSMINIAYDFLRKKHCE